jgi:hypothetical protein
LWSSPISYSFLFDPDNWVLSFLFVGSARWKGWWVSIFLIG